MNNSFILLTITAAIIGITHTVLGPDHYLPFVAVAKSRNWSFKKTIFVTLLCGIGHILSSITISLAGIIFGIAFSNLKVINSLRAEIAAWLLISFGLIYFIWGIKRCMVKNSGSISHHQKTPHILMHKIEWTDSKQNPRKDIIVWILFIIFIFGPCESLIPLLLYPSVQSNFAALLIISTVFMITTIVTMLIIVSAFFYGLNLLKFENFEKYSHAFSGFVIFITGLAIEFLGL